eukprot:Hpha_TRINITY_DN10848_c0_g2::TRINITY_DN10848_c0_g2_i1::g.23507::m.23507
MDKDAYVAWRDRRRGLQVDEEEREVLQRYRQLRHRFRFPGLPEEARARVLQYLPVYGVDWLEDLEEMEGLLQCSAGDVSLFDQWEEVGTRVRELRDTLREEHMRRFGEFAAFANALGVSLQNTHVPERAAASQAIAMVNSLAVDQQDRWQFVGDWEKWHHTQVHTPCRQLRKTLRPSLRRYRVKAEQFAHRWGDALSARLISELEWLESHITNTESVGDEKLLKNDLKNMFWQLGLPWNDSVTEDYPATVTLHMAFNLGLFDTTHVRSYLWEDRQPAAIEDDVDRAEREAAERREQERLKKLEDDAAQERATALKTEAQRYVHRAREAACRRLGERLWVKDELCRMPYTHRWAGCELYATETVHWIAVALREGTTDDVVLSEEGAAEYEKSRVVRDQYLWLYLSDLVDGFYDDLPSAAAIAQAVRERQPHRDFNRPLASS